MIQTKTSTSTTNGTMQTETTVDFVVPGPGYQAVAWGLIEVEKEGDAASELQGLTQVNIDVEVAGSWATGQDSRLSPGAP